MSVLYVVRHGQASFGQAEYDRLSDLGQRQARLTGQHLAQAGLRLDAAYCGAMRRQKDTASALLAGLEAPPPLRQAPGWEEYDSLAIIKALLPAMLAEDPSLEQSLGDMYQDRRAFQRVYEAAMRRWVAGRHDLGPVETWTSFVARTRQALADMLAAHQGGQTVLVVTSGGPIAALLHLALNLEDQVALQMTWVVKNASLSSFLFRGQELTLSTFNSTAHLEQHREPDLLTYR
ncbi:MAG: histidine phosphatase family protein [Pseudomonadota bacterium]